MSLTLFELPVVQTRDRQFDGMTPFFFIFELKIVFKLIFEVIQFDRKYIVCWAPGLIPILSRDRDSDFHPGI